MPEIEPADEEIFDEEPEEEEATEEQRWEILRLVEAWLELPMIVLGFLWLILIIWDFTRGLSPFLENVALVIWGVFVVDYSIRLWLAPRKLAYLKSTWLTGLALVLPALRVFRIVQLVRALRAARAVRGVKFLQVVGSMNRGMRTLHRTMSRRGLGYVVLLTFIVTLLGAAGIYGFERPPDGEVTDYGTALWVTTMIMTTQGSEHWPQTAEGRLLFLLLAIYAVAIFGYLTATIASFFVARDSEEDRLRSPELRSINALRQEILALRQQLQNGGEPPSV